jgi:hypothetical protein
VLAPARARLVATRRPACDGAHDAKLLEHDPLQPDFTCGSSNTIGPVQALPEATPREQLWGSPLSPALELPKGLFAPG